jgi:hypothetical protein
VALDGRGMTETPNTGLQPAAAGTILSRRG